MYLSTRQGLKVVGIICLIAAIIVLFLWLATWPAPAAVNLVLVHTVDGRDIFLNPAQITTVNEGRDPHDPKRELTDKVRCAIGLTNGHYVSVIEECDVVRQLIEQTGKQ